MSGGIDSTACAQYYVSRGDVVSGIFVDYGQPAGCPELNAVKQISKYLGLPLSIMSFRADLTIGSGEIRGRNAFLIFAALMGANLQSGIISLGIHAGTPYYDCSTVFVDQVRDLVYAYSSGKIALHCPFLNRDKGFIYSYATEARIPIHLTYSCEVGTVPPCGCCLSCLDRNALQAN